MKRYEYPRLDEVLCRERLENGLTVAVLPRKGFSKRLAYLVTGFGSLHTDFRLGGKEYHVPAGVAHYLEHKLFDMPDGTSADARFAQLGAMTNAFTSYDMTAYYFSCTENFDECLELLLKFVCTPWFTGESVEKERGIIDQEIGMYADSPDGQVFENLTRTLYHAHPIRVPILGTGETIRAITPETLYTCHRAFYTPENMLLCVIGDVDAEEVAAIARRTLPPQPQGVGEKLPFPEEPMTGGGTVECPMEVAMPMFNLGFKCEPIDRGEDAARLEMVADLAAEALFGESSGLYLRLYEAGLIDSSFGGGFEAVEGCAMLLCSGDSDDPAAVKAAILEEAQRLAREGVPEETFQRLRRSALGRRIRALDSFDSTCFRLCASHFADFDYFRFPALYETIRPEDLRNFLAQTVTENRSALSILTPLQGEDDKGEI